MKNRNNHQLPRDKAIKLEQSSKFFTLGVTPAHVQQEIRAQLRKQGSQSKGFVQGSTMTSPKNVSTNSKKSQHSQKNCHDNIPLLQKLSISGHIKPKRTDGSLLQKKRMKQNVSRYERRQDDKMKLSVMKSLANVININDFHSSVNISEVAQLTIYAIAKNDFNFIEIIGRGTFGNVWKVQHRKTLKFYALKEMSKAIIIINKSVSNIMNEKKILCKLHHPFINKMYGSFTDRDNLYLVLQLLQGGDLRYHMTQHRRFTEQQGKFMIACIIESLQALSTKKIVHRDLKPQNLVFDKKGYLKLTDFGISNQDYTCDTSGTPGYMAPQVLCRLVHNSVADYFALGVVAYQIMIGKRPYNGRNRNQIRQSILSKQISIKKGDKDFRWSAQAIDFINKLIQRQPNHRLGYNGIYQLKQHPWFRKFNWKKLSSGQINPQFVPHYSLRINYQNNNQLNTQILMKHRLLERLSNHNEIFEQYYEPFRQDTCFNDSF